MLMTKRFLLPDVNLRRYIRNFGNLYIPKDFRVNEPEIIQQIMVEYPLATLVVPHEKLPIISHIPLLFDKSTNTLRGHAAKANPLAKAQLESPTPCTAIFHGPNSYISPSWYATKKEHGKVVPTWNLVVVHIQGNLRFISDRDWLYQNVGELSQVHESSIGSDWRIEDAPLSYIDVNLKAIVGLEISIENVEAKFKLSQNRSLEDRKNVIVQLKLSKKQSDHLTAAWMESTISKDS